MTVYITVEEGGKNPYLSVYTSMKQVEDPENYYSLRQPTKVFKAVLLEELGVVNAVRLNKVVRSK